MVSDDHMVYGFILNLILLTTALHVIVKDQLFARAHVHFIRLSSFTAQRL